MVRTLFLVIFWLHVSVVKTQDTLKIPVDSNFVEPVKYGLTTGGEAIDIYERLNARLDGDSVRHCEGYACNGWVEDFYTGGKILHNGYYVDGQLKIYKNFYPNGNVERQFRTVDDYKSIMKTFYPGGSLKSLTHYRGSESTEEMEYYPNGQLEYYTAYSNDRMYYKERKSFFENGMPETTFLPVKKGKLVFVDTEYYANGTVKSTGEVYFDKNLFDYRKNGKWKEYNNQGKLVREYEYVNGMLNAEKSYE